MSKLVHKSAGLLILTSCELPGMGIAKVFVNQREVEPPSECDDKVARCLACKTTTEARRATLVIRSIMNRVSKDYVVEYRMSLRSKIFGLNCIEVRPIKCPISDRTKYVLMWDRFSVAKLAESVAAKIYV